MQRPSTIFLKRTRRAQPRFLTNGSRVASAHRRLSVHGMAHGQLLGNWSERGIPNSQRMTAHQSMHREPVCSLGEGGGGGS